METADAEVLRAREVANSVLASLKSQLTVLRESAVETQQRQWLRLSRELLQTAQTPRAAQATELKLRHEQLRQQREELEKKLKEGKIGLSSAEEVVDGRPHQASGAAPASAPSTATSATSLRPAVKAKGPPPPKAKPRPKPKAAVVGQPTPPRTNGLVNINWKKKAAPGPEDFSLNDDFLREMAELRGHPMDDLELSKESVFQGQVDVPELSEMQLQYWFGIRARQKRPTPCSSRGTSVHSTSRDASGSGSSTPSHGPGKVAQPVFSMLRQRLLDDRTIRSAGLFLARYRMNHGRNGRSGAASPKVLVEDICKAVLQCRIRKDIDGLENLREAMETYAQAGSPVARFVEEQGLEALSNCDPEAEHRLLYQVSCIPGIYERLRCFKIQSSWDKDAAKCKTDLQVLKGGLQVMAERKDVLRRFFSQAMRLGNKLNEAAGGPLAPHGFRMSSLETLMQTKSPWRPKLSLLHVILGLLDAPQVARLAELEQLDPIRAHGLLGKTSGVHERCRDLVMSLSKLRQLVAQVERKCCDKAVPDQQDAFHDYLEKFLENRRQEAVTLAQGCFDLYSGYKELSIFFGEPEAFYPPPVHSSDGAEDMFLFFHRFGEVVVRAKKEIDSMRFREELEAAREGGPEAAAQVAEEVATANGLPIGLVKQRLLPEPVTRADAVLMTPPGSPCRVRNVASPCRGRASDKAISASARAVQRLKKMSATPEADAQSDVSDWEHNSGNRRTSGSPAAPPKVSLGLPRRRLALPRERPQCCTPSSSASSPKWPDEHGLEDDDFASGASQASRRRRRSTSRGCDEDPELSTHAPSDAMEVVLSFPLPSTPTNRRSLSVPRGNEDAAHGRRSEMRQRLSSMANRLESKALSQFDGPADAAAGDPASEADSARYASCCSDSTDSTWETARSCCPLPIGPEANASLNAELKRQVRKRSKPQEFHTPKNHQRINLSPVGEPGETPYRDPKSCSTTKKGQSASAARSERSQGSHQKSSPPVARRLPFDRCPQRKK